MEVERAAGDTGDLFVADADGAGWELGSGAEEDGGAMVVDEGLFLKLLSRRASGWGQEREADFLCRCGQAFDCIAGAG